MIDTFINSELKQNCGDILIPLEKISPQGKYKGIFKKYPFEVYFYKSNALRGEVNNPCIEEEEFINKLWLQNCGSNLQIIRKSTIKEKDGSFKWICKFVGSEKEIIASKSNIKAGRVYNLELEQEFIQKTYPQIDDVLRILELSNKKLHTTPLYKCQFINHPYIIYETKNHILRGRITNPQVEIDFLTSKLWPQNCGDSLRVLEKITKGQNKGKWKCEFQKYPYIVYCKKYIIINGGVENQNFPYKNKEEFIKYIKDNFINNKPTLKELSQKLNLSISHVGLKIREFKLDFLIKYDFGNLQNEVLSEIKKYYKYDILFNKGILENNQEIDIYIPELKIGFEINGNYWHSNLYKSNNYHQEKKLIAKKQNIQLFNIWEWEWRDKEEICVSFIKSKLGIFDKKIGARFCQIKELQYKEYAQFCNENHLQGECAAKIKLGLYCKQELIQIMSFGVPRFTSEYEWEIIRECSKIGYCILGGKEKLWKYFIKKYNPKNCISYCDFSKFNGNSYLKLGFKFKQLNKPGFWWWDKKENIIYWRNPFKHKEMKEKYLQLYDCGQLVFEWYKF